MNYGKKATMQLLGNMTIRALRSKTSSSSLF